MSEAVPVPASLAGERLDRVVAMVAGCSRSEAVSLIASGAVRLDGEVATKPSVRLVEGAMLDVPDHPGTAPAATIAGDPTVPFVVVYADDDVIVVDKPAGVVVHPGAGHDEGTLVHGVLARFPEIASVGDPVRPGIVHRIDKDTSGLLVVARSAPGFDGLSEQVAARSMTRRYLSLLRGHLDAPAGLIDAPIGRSARHPTRMTVSNAGRDARTRYEVIEAFTDPDVSLVRLTLETGRTHQIRVHVAAIGHPVVGDARYGGRSSRAGGQRLDRFFLHAEHLALTHPVTGARLAFDSELPPDLATPLARLRGKG